VTVDDVTHEVSGKVRAVVKKINFFAVYADKELPMSSHKDTKVPTLRHEFLKKFERPEDTESQLTDDWQRRVRATPSVGHPMGDRLVSKSRQRFRIME
jgi:hypothetical protein